MSLEYVAFCSRAFRSLFLRHNRRIAVPIHVSNHVTPHFLGPDSKSTASFHFGAKNNKQKVKNNLIYSALVPRSFLGHGEEI